MDSASSGKMALMGGAGWFTSSAVTVGFFAFIILQIETQYSFRTHTIAAL